MALLLLFRLLCLLFFFFRFFHIIINLSIILIFLSHRSPLPLRCRWVAKQAAHVPALHALKVDSVRRDDYEALCDLCDAFNLAIRQHTATTGEAPLVPGRIVDGFKDSGLIVHIMTQVYNRGVKNPKLLNGYQAFSNEVYGEFNTNMITDVVRSANITEEDTFVDLGSGVGHVVLQMALQARCKLSYGIEIRDVPAKFATNLAADFERRIAWWGCYHSPVRNIYSSFIIIIIIILFYIALNRQCMNE